MLSRPPSSARCAQGAHPHGGVSDAAPLNRDTDIASEFYGLTLGIQVCLDEYTASSSIYPSRLLISRTAPSGTPLNHFIVGMAFYSNESLPTLSSPSQSLPTTSSDRSTSSAALAERSCGTASSGSCQLAQPKMPRFPATLGLLESRRGPCQFYNQHDSDDEVLEDSWAAPLSATHFPPTAPAPPHGSRLKRIDGQSYRAPRQRGQRPRGCGRQSSATVSCQRRQCPRGRGGAGWGGKTAAATPPRFTPQLVRGAKHTFLMFFFTGPCLASKSHFQWKQHGKNGHIFGEQKHENCAKKAHFVVKKQETLHTQMRLW